MPPRKPGRPPKSVKKVQIEILKSEGIPYNIPSISSVQEKQNLYNCKECNKKFKFVNKLKVHISNEHSTLPDSVPCKQCAVVCPNKSVLEKHVRNAHQRDIFYCNACGKEFARQAHVLRHMAQKGCDGTSRSSFPCEICNATFTRKDNLIVHLRQMHIQRLLYHCKYNSCFYETKNFNKLTRHWHTNHAAVPNRFYCDLCGKFTMSRAAMAKHLEIHGDKKYSCDVCKYSTYTVEVMRRHILTHVEEKPFKCQICGESYIQRSQLERHSEKHTVNRCLECNTTFACKARYLIHVKNHTNKNKMLCPYDGCVHSTKVFPDENSLIKHVLRHLSMTNNTSTCAVCKKKFSSEVGMRRHLATHTLDRPRRCMYCVSARAYVRGQQLVRHVRLHHPEVFVAHLTHVRNVLLANPRSERVTKSEMESILNLLDAESERILQGYGNQNVLYGGMQPPPDTDQEDEESPLMSEEALAASLGSLLEHLIDKETLECLGWPEDSVDNILEKVIEQCGAKPADRDMWSRVQRLRENAKHLFLYVVDDKTVANMMDTHTIDQIIKHILTQAQNDDHAQNKQIEIEIAVT